MHAVDFGSLGAFLRSAREAARLSLRQFATSLDYSPSHLGDVERGNRAVTRQMCDKLSHTLGIDRVELYARAGHLTDEVLLYLCRRPKALGVLELLASQDASDETVESLQSQLRGERPRSSASHVATGEPGAPGDFRVERGGEPSEAPITCAMKQPPGDEDLETSP